MNRNVTTEFGFHIGNSCVTVGRFSYGIENINVLQWNEGAALTIGSFCSIAKNVSVFLGGNHRSDWISTFPFGHIFHQQLGRFDIDGHPATNGSVTIGHDVWIGNGVTIMSGIHVGHGAVIAANSHVTKNVDDYTIVGGNPAQILRYRFPSPVVDRLLTLKWWDLPIDIIKSIIPILSSKPNIDVLEELIHTYRPQ
ncbi:CatB-related O-acetyltransferase (plasmid) [Sinorhizobium chiapasense]|uniref:CatB-related O-acetyltransferase n=1 Tax=Sinorhizobium chiapasense TaxID=501572 RepID=UPI002FE416F5